jgi:hypothetical protein
MKSLNSSLVILFILTTGTALTSQTEYVATTGNDSTGTGSQTAPWATIAHAASLAQPGWQIIVQCGTYSGDVSISVSGTASSPITFLSQNQWCAKIVGNGTGDNSGAWTNHGDYVNIVGFDVTGSDALGIQNLGSHDSVLGNKVHDIVSPCDSNGGAGIDDASEGAGSNNSINGNFVYNINGISGCQQAGATPPGIYLTSPNSTVSNNLVVNTPMGMQEWHDTTNETVVNNTFVCNTATSITYGVIVGSGDYPCNAGTSCTNNNSKTANNITYGCTYGIQEEASDGGAVGSGNQYLNNDNYNDTYPLTIIGGGSSSGNLTSNPQFVNNTGDSTGNYSIQSTSAAKDAGTASGAPAVDFAGGFRPMNGSYDIGAYEYGATAGLWPWFVTGITLVQSNAVPSSGVSSVSVGFPQNNTAGDLIVAFVRMSTTTQTVSVSDTNGNVYQDAVSQVQDTDGHQTHIFFVASIRGGANTVTASFSSTNNHPFIAVYEYHGVTALDKTSGAEGSNSTPNSGTTATTTSANELVFSGLGLPSSSSVSVTAGSTFRLEQQDSTAGRSRAASEDAAVTTTGSASGTFSVNSSTNWTCIVATFK